MTMNEYQESVNKIFDNKLAKYSVLVQPKVYDQLLGEAIREALAEQQFNGKK